MICRCPDIAANMDLRLGRDEELLDIELTLLIGLDDEVRKACRRLVEQLNDILSRLGKESPCISMSCLPEAVLYSIWRSIAIRERRGYA